MIIDTRRVPRSEKKGQTIDRSERGGFSATRSARANRERGEVWLLEIGGAPGGT